MKMKKLSALLLTAALSAGMCGAFSLSASAVSGSGTASDPYIVSNEDEFGLIADFPDAHFRLAQDIVLEDSFSAVAQFSGTIDGNGCLVSGLDGQGIISTNTGTIENLIVEIDEINTPFITTNNGTIENTGIVDGEVYSRNGNVGTFARTNNGTISNCFSMTQLTVGGMYESSSVGGFVGMNNGVIENCLYTGHIYCQGTTTNGNKLDKFVSPFVGDNDEDSGSAAVTSCYYNNDETSSASKNSGGASGKSPTGLTIQATYEGWDFANTWAIDSSKNDGYPYLQCDRRFNGQALPAATATPAPTKAPTAAPTSTPTAAPVAPTAAPAAPTAAPQSDEITVNVNGSRVSFDQPPIITNDRTLVPMRAIFEALGATVDWNSELLIASAVRDNIQIGLQIGGYNMTKITDGMNVEIIELDVAPMVVNDRTLVPVRAIAESFQCTVEWDGATKTVNITDSSVSSPSTPSNSGSNTQTQTQTSACSVCGGTGRVTCNFCGGTGQGLPMNIVGIETPQGCTYCGSAGWRVCDSCGGSGQV